MDIGKIIVLAVSLAIIGGVTAGTLFSNFAVTGTGADRQNYTGILAIVMPFVPVLFGVGILYVVLRELKITGK